MPNPPHSHALVLPDRDFASWYAAAGAYTAAFSKVAVIRSPRGIDLNRYHTVTAVRTSGVWFGDDPVAHIRRAYPAVVRIDVIAAASAAQLEQILAARVQTNDRFGALVDDGHLIERFTLGWASDHRPARIVTRYGAVIPNTSTNGAPAGTRQNEGIDLATSAGAILRAPADGVVMRPLSVPAALGYGNYVQIYSEADGKSYLVTLSGMTAIDAQPGASVAAGDRIGVAAGAASKLVVQERPLHLQRDRPSDPITVDPTPLLYWEDMRLQPTGDGLRVRQQPNTQAAVLATINRSDLVETLELHGRTLEKVGVQGEWLNIRTRTGVEGWCAAWFLQAVTLPAPSGLPGVNLDPTHPLGKPAPARVSQLDWLRIAYKAVPTQGFATLDAAHGVYAPILAEYAASGAKLIIVLTHQTFGEGAGFNWADMYAANRARWNEFIPLFVNAAKSVAQRYAGRGIVSAYQIWNEQDTDPADARAAVPIQAADYAALLRETARAIRAIDPAALILTGGHVGGPVRGGQYAQSTLAALPADARPDGLAVHPYGRGAPGANPRCAPFGVVDEEVNAYYPLLNAPVWFTEWGVLNLPNDPAVEVAKYATGFLDHLALKFSAKVKAAVWYAWADTMDNGYGLVNSADQPKQPLYDQFMGV